MNKCVRRKLLAWLGEQCRELLVWFVITMLVLVICIGFSALARRFNVSFDVSFDDFKTLCLAPFLIAVLIGGVPIDVYMTVKEKLNEVKAECAREEDACQNGNS